MNSALNAISSVVTGGLPVWMSAASPTELKGMFNANPQLLASAESSLTSSPVAPQLLNSKGLPAFQALSPSQHYSDQELRKVSREFEAVFIRMMFKVMRQSVPPNPLFGKQLSMSFFNSMYDSDLSTELSHDSGFGISKMIYSQLKTNVENQQKIV
jgi:flagellar protein FlgJ